MPDYDLIVRGAHPWPTIGITDGRIAGLADGSAREELDATGLLVLPGVVDAHVHFNEPGRTEWEGWATGSRAAVAGGITTVFDMPLNSHPPVVTADAFDAKLRAAQTQSVCDFALWGGLVPRHVDDLDALAARGVIGFKAFMAHSGIDDFPKVDTATLRAGMQRAAALRLPVAVHAELDREVDAERGARREREDDAAPDALRRRTIAAFLASRPIESECDAIRIAIDLAAETGCALHVVHVSSGRGIALIAAARARGVDVTAETCPHYLVLTRDDVERLGAVAKCAPPLRDAAERDALMAHVRAGRVDTIGSDHSPSPASMKVHDDFFRVWGGIAGVQHLLPLLLDAGLDPALIARLTAEQVARRFRLPHKGRIAIGCDADLALVELRDTGPAAEQAAEQAAEETAVQAAMKATAQAASFEITADALYYRHRLSPYVGRRIRARVRRTILRGRTVYRVDADSADTAAAPPSIADSAGGRLLTPSSS